MFLDQKRDFREQSVYMHKIQNQYHPVASFSDDGNKEGIWVALKDNISLKNVPMQAGSKILEGYIPVFDATVVQKLRRYNAYFPCKTSMDEFGMGDDNRNTVSENPINPFNSERIVGGSSGGSALVVALDAVPLAIGTDTGDSIRRPASFMGVVGLKPSYGRISRYGIVPYASSLDTVGTFTTSVYDACLALEMLQGKDKNDLTSVHSETSYSLQLDGSLRSKTIGVFMDSLEADPYLVECMDKIIAKISSHGAKVVFLSMPKGYMDLVDPVYSILANAEACSNHSNLNGICFGNAQTGDSWEESAIETRTQGISLQVKKRFLLGAYALQENNLENYYFKAQKMRRMFVQAYNRLLDQADALISLTTNDIAPYIGSKSKGSKHLQLDNFSGTPSISIPLGFKEGCPFGICIHAKIFEEAKMFDVALAIEKLTGLQGFCLKENEL